ncbi:MAG: site-2 protease family protein [Algicola sp.]|nr:site-2 protease family protein [Algicola sp.]
MELLKIDYLGQPLRVEGSMAGWQALFWNNELVSQKTASASSNGQFVHEFNIQANDQSNSEENDSPAKLLRCRIQLDVQWQPFEVLYQLYVDDELMADGKRNYKDIEHQVPFDLPQSKRTFSLVSLTTFAVKLFKSAKMIKLTLAGASLAVYSGLFSLTFGMALFVSLIFHEWGRVLAMKHFGLKTRGIYLIPFFGGFAMRDEKVNTRWQAVVIALMGPCFGLLMSLVYMLVYGLTDDIFFAALASLNALLNVFTLFPILPLDGGHIVKNISASMNIKTVSVVGLGVVGIAGITGLGLGLTLFALLLLVGSAEIMVAWRKRHDSHLLALDHYGQLFAAVWYFVTVTCLIGVIWFFAGMGDDMLGLPLRMLQS